MAQYRHLQGWTSVAPRVRQSEAFVQRELMGRYRLFGLGPEHALLCSALPALETLHCCCCCRNGHQSAPPGPGQVTVTDPMSKFPNPSSPLQTISLQINATDAQRGSVLPSISPSDAPIRPLATAISPSEPSSNALTPPEAEPEPDPEPDAADTQRG
ncbi:uncharacterized protein TRIVIDRAFT_226272 [Trichoderma virens Gv29-8]|uniref:Uncharacterized protein n=1 Tax=Hypocrea virens (strain Gv29-8 / FGSC 10586) TaxID=413071 RepID=G9N5X0_HYPVG|nr:uncharacterized protein TRIVIDRAFT_226272 [Trichoderma virens Gv29-8]EHK18161.1 hypothetical protein TRIVIDRAFT_226272 [Trichoderma virens Gv29-8]